MTPEYYLQLMTMHGTIMVFFVLTTAPFAAFGNYFLPIQVGAEDMPFPAFQHDVVLGHVRRLLVLISAFFVGDGPSLGGWTQYAPLSAVGAVAGPGEGLGTVLWAASIAIFCIGQLLGALNFITTTLDLRVKGMSLMRLPLSAWAWFITSCMGLTAFAVLMPACILLILDHVAGTSFFVAIQSGDQRPTAAALGRIDAAVAAPVLVLRTSRGLHRDRARHGHRFPCSDHQHAQADAEPQSADLLHGSARRAQLHGLWTSHVCQRDESVLVAGVFLPHAGHHHPVDHHRADLDRKPVRLQVANHLGLAVCLGLHFDVRQRRREWLFPGATLDRHHAARDLLRGRATSTW